VFDAIARSSHFLGDFGNGSKMKYIANLLVAVHNLATAEAHALGIAAGMDPASVQRVMEDGVGSSKIFEIRGPMMVADQYVPAARLDLILKDALLIADYARSVGAPTPLLEAALHVYEDASAAGLGDLDAAALCRYLEQSAGLTR
jgi:putative dehydrogenase